MPALNQNPEQIARDQSDALLVEAGWVVQKKSQINFGAGQGIAVREYQTYVGPADYVLFIDRKERGAGKPGIVRISLPLERPGLLKPAV